MKRLAFILGLLLLSVASAQAQIVVGVTPKLTTADLLQVKNTKGAFLDGYVTTSGVGYLFVFNTTSASVPANGSVTAGIAATNYQDCIYIPAAGTYGLSAFGLQLEQFSTGIYMAWSTTGCGTLTLATTNLLLMKGRAQ